MDKVYDKEAIKLLDDLHKLLVEEALVKGTDRDSKVVQFISPEELQQRIDLKVGEDGVDNERLLSLCKDVIQYSVQTGHPRFYNQFYSGRHPVGLAGAWLTEALNTNLHTFEVGPVFVLIEREIIESLRNLVGYPSGDGVFVPGGSFGNLMALHIARFRWDKEVKTKGMFSCPKLIIFTSEDSHYSFWKGAHFLGFGTDSIVAVKSDAAGKMDAVDLEKKILQEKEKGHAPMMVGATTGTTVLGAFDPLEPIADICEKYNLWLHADASWGGGVLLSEKHKHVFKGLERTNSVVWSIHKMLGPPVQCTAVLVKEKGLLLECNGRGADYIFQQDKYYDVGYDIGDCTVQCGRKVDSLKFWLMWKSMGTKGLRAHVDNIYENAHYFKDKLKATEGFRLVLEEIECTNVCFWYIPPRLNGAEENQDWWKQVAKVTTQIKEGMVRAGTMMIGYCPLVSKGYVNFFRIVFDNYGTTRKDLDFTVAEILRIGKDL